MVELAYNLESFNPAFTAVLLKVHDALESCHLCMQSKLPSLHPLEGITLMLHLYACSICMQSKLSFLHSVMHAHLQHTLEHNPWLPYSTFRR